MNLFSGNKTFKPLKTLKGKKAQQLSEIAKKTLSTLGSGSMMAAVKLPKGEDINEWMAVNTVDFFNEISMLYGTISEYCTKTNCPVMSAGPKFQYRWADGVKVKKPMEVTAPEYVDLLLTWAESQLNDEDIFPINFGSPFPKNFGNVIRNIFKRYFRVYAHIYHSHFEKIQSVGASPHLNTCFKHFIYFVKYWKLVDEKELKPLEDIIKKLVGTELEELEKATPTPASDKTEKKKRRQVK